MLPLLWAFTLSVEGQNAIGVERARRLAPSSEIRSSGSSNM